MFSTNDTSVKTHGGDWHSQICPLIYVFRRKCGEEVREYKTRDRHKGVTAAISDGQEELCQQSSRSNGEKRHGKSWNS